MLYRFSIGYVKITIFSFCFRFAFQKKGEGKTKVFTCLFSGTCRLDKIIDSKAIFIGTPICCFDNRLKGRVVWGYKIILSINK